MWYGCRAWVDCEAGWMSREQVEDKLTRRPRRQAEVFREDVAGMPTILSQPEGAQDSEFSLSSASNVA